jgi:glycogen synthase
LNIWLLTSEYPPDYGGGIGMYVNMVAEMFASAGHETSVIVRDAHRSVIEKSDSGVRVVRFRHMEGEYYSYLGYWTALAYQYADVVVDLIKRENKKPDVIEVQEYNAIGYYILLRKWQKDPVLKDIPVVVHLHTPTFELDRINQAPRYKFPNYWIGQMEKFCIKAADALISPSHFLKEKIHQIIPGIDIQTIPLPYQLDHDGVELDRSASETFLYFGRTEYRKGVSQMLAVAERLWRAGRKFKLKLIGGDTYFHPKATHLGELLRKKYEHRINEGVLIFKDAIPPHELTPEIKQARAVIVPSLYENFPYTCLSSMWLGAPLLVSSSGGQAEMVGMDSGAGYVFDWNQEGDMEEKWVRLIEANAIELRSMSGASKSRIHSMCNMSDNLKRRISFYEEVIRQTENAENVVFPTLLEQCEPSTVALSSSDEQGLLSIIIPYYNMGEYVEETIESALRTEYQHYEIIIINDGSTEDESLRVLDQYRSHPSIRVIDIDNQGLANARNVGAKAAKGEYIAFLDADDLVEPSFYPKCIEILDNYSNVSFVYSWLEYFGNSQATWPTFNTEFPYLLASNMLSAFVVVRKNDFLQFGMNKSEMEYGMEDYEGWVAMCANGRIGVSIPEKLVKYRVRSNSMSRQFNRDLVIYLRDKLSDLNAEAYAKHGGELFKLIDANGPGYLWDNPTLTFPPLGFGSGDNTAINDINARKHELMRIAHSKWGSRMIKLLFKLRVHKILK